MNKLNEQRTLNKLEKIAENITNWIGSVSSLIVHTIFFIISFLLPYFGANTERVLLVVTTIVSLEAIYLAIFIQMSINRTSESLEEVGKDIDELQEDIDEIQEDVVEINQDIDVMQADDVQDQEHHKLNKEALEKIRNDLEKMIAHIEDLKKQTK